MNREYICKITDKAIRILLQTNIICWKTIYCKREKRNKSEKLM